MTTLHIAEYRDSDEPSYIVTTRTAGTSVYRGIFASRGDARCRADQIAREEGLELPAKIEGPYYGEDA